jgi:hypothetical protein
VTPDVGPVPGFRPGPVVAHRGLRLQARLQDASRRGKIIIDVQDPPEDAATRPVPVTAARDGPAVRLLPCRASVFWKGDVLQRYPAAGYLRQPMLTGWRAARNGSQT